MADEHKPKTGSGPDTTEQPGPELREQMRDPETERRDAEDRDITNEAHRWGREGNSREERGYPREGGSNSTADKS